MRLTCAAIRLIGCASVKTQNWIPVEIRLHYAITRKDLQHFYAYMWRKKLWMYHVAILLIAGLFTAWLMAQGSGDVYLPLVIAFAAIAFLFVYPQLNYKPQTRELILTETGFETTIGAKSGTASWNDIAGIADRDGYLLIVRKNLNTLIVPSSAFSSPEARLEAFTMLKSWLEASRRT